MTPSADVVATSNTALAPIQCLGIAGSAGARCTMLSAGSAAIAATRTGAAAAGPGAAGGGASGGGASGGGGGAKPGPAPGGASTASSAAQLVISTAALV